MIIKDKVSYNSKSYSIPCAKVGDAITTWLVLGNKDKRHKNSMFRKVKKCSLSLRSI